MKKRLLAGTISLAAGLALAPGAFASTVTVTGGNTVRVLESGDQVNRIGLSYDGPTDLYIVTDSASNLTPSGTCTAVDAHAAACPGAGIKTLSVDTGAQADSINMDPTSIPGAVLANFDGGSGDDTVTGHGTLEGGSGNDYVVGLPLADNLRGGSGRDLLDGGDGPDDLVGGSGTDTLTYPVNRTSGVNITVGSGNFNDGGPEDLGSGRRDTVHGDVETVIGTVAGDLVAGDSTSETLIGGPGNDVLSGNNGGDTLLGLEGDDVLVGGNGHDLLRGWLGADRLFGGPDGDRVSGGPDRDLVVGNRGPDVLTGKGGIDLLLAKDGAHDLKIKCGRGANKAERAKRDKRLDPRPRSC